MTTITLDHTLYTNLAQQQYQGTNLPSVQQNQNLIPTQNQQNVPQFIQPQTQRPNVQQTRPPTRVPIPPRQPQIPTSSSENFFTNSNERLNEFSSQCGVPNHRVQESTGLVVNGKAAIKGQVGDFIVYR